MSVLIDANLLVYGALESSVRHRETRRWLQDRFADDQIFVGLTWSTLYGFMRLVSNPIVTGSGASAPAEAWRAAEAYRLQRNVRMVGAGEGHAEIAGGLARMPGIKLNDFPDVFLAAVAIEHGLELCSHDHGFARFTGLRWSNPLSG